MKKKVALSATAIAVLASAVPAHVTPVEAASDVVYVSFTQGNDNHAGNGSTTNPYNLFDDALRAVADGGTIIVRGTGFLNDVNNDGMPYYINKSVKIIGEQGTDAKLSVRPAGLVLGGNLTLENIAIDMYNSADDSIFVNGHTLTMTDVTRFKDSRLVDIFGGTYNHSSNPSYNTGSKSVINITTTSQFSGTTQLGNIYAGSMLGDFDREVEINLTNGATAGKLQVGAIASSGAYAPIPKNMFDFGEPDAPEADPSLFKVSKDVTITLSNMNPSIDGNTGTSAVTSLKYIGKNLVTINASNIKNLDLDGEKFTKYSLPQGILNNGLNKLTLSETAILDLTNYDTGKLNISTYKGTGAIALPQQGVAVNIANDFEPSDEVTLYLGSYNPYGQNGYATKNHVYFTTPSGSATFNYEPHSEDSEFELRPIQKDSRVEWTIVDPNDLPVTPDQPNPPKEEEGEEELPKLPTITEFKLVGEATKVVANDTDIPFFEFKAEGTGDLKALDLIDNFKITINDNATQKVTQGDDGRVYYKSQTDWVDAYIEYDESTGNHKLYLQPFSNSDSLVYTEDKYTIVLSYGEEVPALTFTANVGKEEPPADGEGETSEPTLTGIKLNTAQYLVESYSAFGADKTPKISSSLEMETEGEVPSGITLDYFKPTIKVGQDEAKFVEGENGNYYRVDDLNLNISFEANHGTKEQIMDITFVDDKGQSTVPTKGSYEFAISKGDIGPVTFTLTIQDFPVTNPTVQGFTKNSYTFEGYNALELPIDFEVQFVNKPSKPVEFHELEGSKVSFLGEEWTYEDGLYRHEHHVFGLEIKAKDEVGKYTATFKDPDGQYTVPSDTHSFILEASGKQTKLDYKVKLHITNLTAEGEVEKTFTPEDFNNSFFTFNADVDNEFSDLTTYNGFDIVVNGKPATPQINEFDGTFSYLVEEENIKVHFTKISEGKYNLHVSPYDGSTTLPEPKSDKYVIEFKNYGVSPLTFTANVKKEEPGNNNGGSQPEPEKPKDEEPKPEPEKPSGGSGGSSSGGSGGSSGGTVTPTPPSTGGTTLPAPDPKPEKPTEKPPVVEEQPKPTPPQQEETKPTSRPTVKPNAVASAVEALEDLAKDIQEKVDSLMTEILEQAKGLILDLTGDKDDLSSVSTLEVTKDGIFANVDGEKVKFGSDLKLEDMSKLRILRADGSPVPYTTDGKSFTIDTNNFSDILITERVVEPFVDVAKGDWFQPYVDELYNRGVTTGTTATTFSPNGTITRAQVAALLARAYELKPTGDKPALKDINNQWYADDVQALIDAGIIKGYEDGTFRGDKEVTREQLVIMLQRLEEQRGKDTSVSNVPYFTDKDKMSNEGKSAIEWAASKGIVNSGKNTAFKPKGPATRAQVAKMLTQFMKK